MPRPYSYAALSDVTGYIAGATFGASTRPTASQVANGIDLCADELDSLLSRLDYATPLPTTATASVDMARAWVTVGGAYRAAMAMPQGRESKHAEAYGKEWKALLESLEGGKRSLPDAPKLKRTRSPAVAPGSEEPTFTRANAQTLR
jgi:hypothetical protein